MKQLHPDLNGVSADAQRRTQQLNAAYEILGDSNRRQTYDAEPAHEQRRARTSRSTHASPLTQDVYLRIEEFFHGTALEVRVNDPGNPNGPELYTLNIPPETAPGLRFKVSRASGGCVNVRVRVRANYRFKIRGSDLRCDLRIPSQRAAQGGTETVPGPAGTRLRVNIPRGVARGEILRIAGEGLPKPRGGRGDLLVRIVYRPDVRITRASRR